MTISFQCSKCGQKHRTKSEYAGKRTKCPGCGQALTIPHPKRAKPIELNVDYGLAGEASQPVQEPGAAEKSTPSAASYTPARESPSKDRPRTPCPHCDSPVDAGDTHCSICGLPVAGEGKEDSKDGGLQWLKQRFA